MVLPLLALWLAVLQNPPEIPVAATERAPVLDGRADDAAWQAATERIVPVTEIGSGSAATIDVRLRACRTREEIFFLLVWPDASRDVRHKPWVWNKQMNEYEALEMLEDAAVLAFELEGPFDPNMMAGVESKWDVWQWKAARTDPAGHAMDKWHQYSRRALKGARRFNDPDGRPLWIGRYEDEGTSVTAKIPKPGRKEGDEVAQFTARKPSGSAADLRAKGAWKDRTWTVELARKLSTGHKDDTTFEIGKGTAMAIAILDQAEDAGHHAGEELRLVLK